MKKIALFLIASLFVVSISRAQTVSYQGTIIQSDGSPAEGQFHIAVSLWPSETGGTAVWSDEFVTQVTQGVFNIAMGSNKSLPQDMSRPLWLSVSINNNATTARTRLSGVPYALSVPDSSITSGKLATDYVSSISINGEKVTGRGTPLNISAGNGIEATLDPGTQSLLLSLGNAIGGKGAKQQDVLSGGAPVGCITPTACNTNCDGGVASNLVVGGCDNTTRASQYSTIVGGVSNIIRAGIENCDFTFIGGGYNNTIEDGINGVIGGGSQNHLEEENAVIGGGVKNWNGGPKSFIGGGEGNVISSNGNSYSENDMWDVIAGGNTNRIDTGAVASVIGGGKMNRIQFNVNYATIGGGDTNMITLGSPGAVIAGGDSNTASAPLSVISGGYHNLNQGAYASIVGGDSNTILAGTGATHSGTGCFIGGGANNTIALDLDGDGDISLNTAIVAGQMNIATESYSFIGSGYGNVVAEDFGVIVGGQNNLDSAELSFMGGGEYNRLALNDSDNVIAGGNSNWIRAFAHASSIVGGYFNTIDSSAQYSFIGGGDSNLNRSSLSAIAGGSANTIKKKSDYSFIGSGYDNRIDTSSPYTSIVGGYHNLIDTISAYCIIGGGESNHILLYSDHSIIGGGQDNIVETPSWGAILGGWQNHLGPNGWATSLVGGDSNTVHYSLAFLGGGWHNTIGDAYVPYYGNVLAGGGYNHIDGGDYNVIAGGWTNKDFAHYSAIGGGTNNTINSGANNAIVPGGDHLVANEYGQTVVGFYNVGSATNVTDTASAVAHGDDPLFIIGNGVNVGGTLVQSNAATVSYNGHITATQELTTGAATIPGTLYANNNILAWGNVAASASVLAAGIGVATVVWGGAGSGKYTITLNVPGHTFTNSGCSMVATIEPPVTGVVGGEIVVRHLTPGVFEVYTFDSAGNLKDDRPFQFQVVAN